jgi:hypothetical protein
VTENYDAVEKIGVTLKHDGKFLAQWGNWARYQKTLGDLVHGRKL